MMPPEAMFGSEDALMRPCTCGPHGVCARSCRNRLVLGLDPGKTTGWCLYHPNQRPIHGLYDLPGADLGAQLDGFRDWLATMLVRYEPALIAIERPFGRAAFTSDLPGTLCGVAHMVAHQCLTPRREFTASAIKKHITGSGRATKADVIKAVRGNFGLDVLSDHQADAAAVAIIAWSREAQRA